MPKQNLPMKRALLPLNALRAFDAAARHLSFRRGAEELSVTPAAVSQQVRSLEEYLGVPLFRRFKNRLELTAQAAKALPLLQEGFHSFEEAVRILRSVDTTRTLRLSVPAPFGSKWLLPRLGEFYDVSHDIVVHVSTDPTGSPVDWPGIDVAIRYGPTESEGLFVEELFRETILPVCNPALLDGRDTPASPQDLLALPLIHDTSRGGAERQRAWDDWFAAAGVPFEPAGRRDLHVGGPQLVLEAALAGRGVALAAAAVVRTEIEAGRLVRPVQTATAAEYAYCLVFPEHHLERPKVQSFVAWLRDAAQEENEQ